MLASQLLVLDVRLSDAFA
ncbi:hypothetical protein [Vibrio cholerae]